MLKTAYPGLLAGTGYAHGVDSASDIKLGFSLDYVTGQPYIPGSSVKGLLRSYFSYPDVIREFLGKDLTDKEVKALMLDIFEENDRSAADTDIFFDAVIRRGDENGRILGFDAITPHGEDLTKNPVPIKMIKILPDVVIEFSFRLNPSKIGEYEISPEEKTNLFKEILCTFGIGAKTNVGYGVLAPVSSFSVGDSCICIVTDVKKKQLNLIVEGTEVRLYVKLDALDIDVKDLTTRFEKGDKIPAQILSFADGKFNVKLLVE